MLLFFLSSGLFLGWSLGANDASNIFGTAVGSRMVKFRTAAIVASIFVILGATFQGEGGSDTLNELGSVDAIAGSFTVALASALTVFLMTKLRLKVSTSQAIVGAIIGWNAYAHRPTDMKLVGEIASTWVIGMVLGAIFAILLFFATKRIFSWLKLHLIWKHAVLKIMLIVIGAFGAYSLGANNIVNVMGVFVNSIGLSPLTIGPLTLSGAQQLFFIGALAISLGIFTYSKRVIETVGNDLMPLSAETAMVVVLAQSIVLFVFSSKGLSDAVAWLGLGRIPQVPISSTQVVIGAIVGIGLLKGGNGIKYKVLWSIMLGWVATPLLAGIASFILLFVVSGVFQLPVCG